VLFRSKFGEYVGLNANFYNGQNISAGIVCYSGRMRSRDPDHVTCKCIDQDSQCLTLENACQEIDNTFSEEPYIWLTRRGDPVIANDSAAFGFWSASFIVAVVANYGWLCIASFVSVLLFNMNHSKLVYMGIQAVAMQYLYALLVSTFGTDDPNVCYTKRKALNWIVGDVLLVMLLSAMLAQDRRKLRKDVFSKKQLGVPDKMYQEVDSDEPNEDNDDNSNDNDGDDSNTSDISDKNTSAKRFSALQTFIEKVVRFLHNREAWIGLTLLHMYYLIVYMFVACGRTPLSHPLVSPEARLLIGKQV